MLQHVHTGLVEKKEEIETTTERARESLHIGVLKPFEPEINDSRCKWRHRFHRAFQ